MKASQQTRQMIVDRIKVALAYNRISVDQVKSNMHLWQLWHWINCETRSGRNNLFPVDERFPLYPDDTNDDSMSTALNWAIGQIRKEQDSAPMKDSMRFVFRQVRGGWEYVQECQSFSHACQVARELMEQTCAQYCVNSR